jgi:type VI secretion system protein ImpG
MSDELLEYYERELAFLRQAGRAFREMHPAAAARLRLEDNKCDDPYVERLLEGFSFLTARIHQRIDEDVPEISDALLSVVYPHHVRPIPSMALLEFQLDPEQGRLPHGFKIDRNTPVYSHPVAGTPCTFRTCYDTTLWPVSIAAAQWLGVDRLRLGQQTHDAVGGLRIELRCLGDLTFETLELDTLRLYLDGDGGLVHTLYELLCNNCTQVLVREPMPNGRDPLTLLPVGRRPVLQPVGFAPNEAVLPYSNRSFAGYRLLQEYFTFPYKYLFLDLSGFAQVRKARFGQSVEVIFLIKDFEPREERQRMLNRVTAQNIRLGCTPIINLFQKASEPVRLTYRRPEYPVEADTLRPTTEIFSIDGVVVEQGSTGQLRYEPFYSFRHEKDQPGDPMFWHATRRLRVQRKKGDENAQRKTGDEKWDLYLSFVDLSARMVYPDVDTVTAELTCFDGNLPSILRFGEDPRGDFSVQGADPVQRIRTVVAPTPVIRPPTSGVRSAAGRSVPWQLVSQLSLNYLSLTGDGGNALREILRLHNPSDDPAGQQHIQSILTVQTKPTYAQVSTNDGLVHARGQQVDISFDEAKFGRGGVYLFASVLEHFLGLYASMNSFVSLVARSSLRRTELATWPARAGERTLL